MNVTFKVNEIYNNFAIPTAIYNLMNAMRKKNRGSTLWCPVSILMQFYIGSLYVDIVHRHTIAGDPFVKKYIKSLISWLKCVLILKKIRSVLLTT